MSGDGQRRGSVGGWARVSGAATYVADVRVPGALHVAFVHSPLPSATITSIDRSAALATPGVVDVITAEDVGEILLGRALRDYPALAAGQVLFAGQRIAAVAAVDRATARAAAARIEVEYEERTPLIGLDAAMAAGRDALHPGYADYAGAVSDRPGPNTQGVWRYAEGDADAALAAADRVFEHTFVVARSSAAPIEPHACVIAAGGGRVDAWATHKEPYNLRLLLAAVAEVPVEDVRVHLLPIGGDFGSKGFPFVEAACCLLALRTGRPVRHTMSYYDELVSTAARHPLRMRLRTGVTGGKLTALDAETALDGGAFGGVKAAPMVVVPVIHAPYGSYAVHDRKEICVSYYSNALPGGHVRSPGEFQALFAAESQIDVIADALAVDPVEFRLSNAANDRVRRVVEEVAGVVQGWRTTRRENSGIGVALTFRDTGPGRTTVRAVADRSSVEIQISVADQGAGSYELFRRLAAETLAVAPDRVHVRTLPAGADPDLTDAGAGASRVSAVAGKAVVAACTALLQKLGDRPENAPKSWFAERVAEIADGPVAAEGTAAAGWPAAPGVDVRSHGAVAVELGVDGETGDLVLHRALLVADTGRVINPVAHRGQLEGGFVYGLSQTILEELVVEDGVVTTASLGDYKIASAADVPPLEVRVLPPHPASGDAVLSVGELINVGVAPAVANAIADATGVRIHALPLTPERVLAALERRENLAVAEHY